MRQPAREPGEASTRVQQRLEVRWLAHTTMYAAAGDSRTPEGVAAGCSKASATAGTAHGREESRCCRCRAREADRTALQGRRPEQRGGKGGSGGGDRERQTIGRATAAEVPGGPAT